MSLAAQIIKKLVVDHRMRQNEIAEILGCHQCAVSKYLHGERTPSLKRMMTLVKLAKSRKIKVKLEDFEG